jgi:UTP--glucose-1-phosphate uridylyltransferase
VTSPGKGALEAHFSVHPELETALEGKGDADLLEKVKSTSRLAEIRYVMQQQPLGLGHAILVTKELVGDEPFAVFLPDDLFAAEPPLIKQMAEVYRRFGGSVLALLRVVPEDTRRYGIVNPEQVAERTYRILDMVEKPLPEEAPSQLAIMGRYLLTPQIFDALEATTPGKGGEIQLTDGLALLRQKQDVYGLEFEGKYYDAGKPLGLLKTSIEWALRHPEMGPDLREYLKSIVNS